MEYLEGKVGESWDTEASVEEKWKNLKSALCEGLRQFYELQIENSQIGLGRMKQLSSLC